MPKSKKQQKFGFFANRARQNKCKTSVRRVRVSVACLTQQRIQAYLHTTRHPDPCRRLATIDMGRQKLGRAAVPLWVKERKGKEEYLYSAFSHQGTYKVLRHGLHSFTCKQHHACLSTTATEAADIQLQLTYSFIDPERMKG